MQDFLYKILSKKKKCNLYDERAVVGERVSIIGIFVNVILFIGKFITGVFVCSISMQADAINNLSDAGASIISLISFKISSKPADRKHPFGHARIEYVSSMIVSFVILVIAIELLRDSLHKIINPSGETVFSVVSIVVLSISVIFKLLLVALNKCVSKKINSDVMKATAADSFSDAIATFAILVSMIISKIADFDIDGYMGIAVSVIIFVAGIKILSETKDHILGTSPDEEIVKGIKEIVSRYPMALGMHDMMIHNYGPKRTFASLHVEVDGEKDIFESHDLIDNIEKQIKEELDIVCTIHMDPVVTNNEKIDELHRKVLAKIKEINKNFAIHDFRFVDGVSHKNILFDIEVPFEEKMDDEEIKDIACAKVREICDNYYAIISVDRK